jgi:MFS family permease
VKKLGGEGVNFLGTHLGIGLLSGIIAAAFTLAQLVSSPMWGRFSDKFGRRPALLIALASAGVAYLVFGFAESLFVLFLSRIVQGAGGGTVGVIQAYVADTTEPEDRARALGWLSAATNLGVSFGPVVGAFAVYMGKKDLVPGGGEIRMGEAAPGIVAALLCAITILFAWRYLKESKEHHHHESERRRPREAVLRVLTHGRDPSSRLIWIYAIAIGAFQGTFPVLPLFLNSRFQVTEATIGYFFMYIGSISVFARVLLLGKLVDRLGEARLSRFGLVLLAVGLAGMPLAPNFLVLALAVAMLPLGTAFTFPCVTAMLSRVINPADRGLYMGLQQSFGGVSRIIAPLWAGFAFDTLGMGVPFFTAAVFVLGTITLGLGLDEYAKRPARLAAIPPPPAA